MSPVFPLDARGNGAALMRADRGSSRPALSGPPVMLFSQPMGKPVAVRVDPVVLEQIDAAHFAVNEASGEREVGGYLIARRVDLDRIIFATDSGFDHRSDGLRLRDPWAEEARHTRAGVSTIVGCWHVHPAGEDARPSQGDLTAFHAALITAGAERWYSLIATRGDVGWRLAGYVTRLRAGIAYRAKVEPMAVHVG